MNNLWVENKIKAGTERFFEKYENKDTAYQNFCNTAKAMLGDKFTALNVYIEKVERPQFRSGV